MDPTDMVGGGMRGMGMRHPHYRMNMQRMGAGPGPVTADQYGTYTTAHPHFAQHMASRADRFYTRHPATGDAAAWTHTAGQPLTFDQYQQWQTARHAYRQAHPGGNPFGGGAGAGGTTPPAGGGPFGAPVGTGVMAPILRLKALLAAHGYGPPAAPAGGTAPNPLGTGNPYNLSTFTPTNG